MKITLIVLAAVLAVVTVVLVILGSVDIPAPSGEIQKPLPADKLLH